LNVDLWAPVLRHLVAPLWARWERSPYLQHYLLLRRTQFDAPEVIRSRQWQLLSSLLRHAYSTTPFWRQRLDQAGLHPDEVRSWDDFLAVPVMTKHDLRTHGPDMISSLFDPASLHRKKTSGSTGVSVQVAIDEASLQFKRATTLRSDEWSGYRFGERVAMVWGNPEYLKRGLRGRLRNLLLERARYLDTLKMDQAALARFAESLVRIPPSLLFGHAHSVYLFAEFVGKAGITSIRPKGIITSAMVLHSWQRRVIERVFGCPVTNRYGCEEVSLIACECERHEGLHVNADGVYVEVLVDGRPARPGEAGSVVVTDLTNRAQPIIRYQVGDVAVMTDRRCPCGRGLPLLERLEGREADYVVTASGELISGISLTENFALHVPGVAQLQIVQEEVQRFLFRIVRGPDFGPVSLRRIGDLVEERFGIGTCFEFEYVDQIPQEPSGKYRFCISRVPNPFAPSQEVVK
jgi:phenylacetate-CoA ligase